MSKVWNITCECGYDLDFKTIREARKEAAQHKTHNEDGKVYIDQIDTEGNAGNGSDYQTGKSIIV